MPLAQIGDVSADTDSTPGVLRNLDAELQRRIERLKKARPDIAAILRTRTPADVPAGFESVAARLSEADSSMIHISGQLYDQNALADVQKMVEADTDDVSADIDRSPADADEETRNLLVSYSPKKPGFFQTQKKGARPGRVPVRHPSRRASKRGAETRPYSRYLPPVPQLRPAVPGRSRAKAPPRRSPHRRPSPPSIAGVST